MEKRVARRSIKKRILIQIFATLGLTYLITLTILLSLIRIYFYRNYFSNMKREITISSSYFQDNIGIDVPLIENIYLNQDTWWKSQNVRVQLFDSSGVILMDSQAILDADSPDVSDVTTALNGETGSSVFRLNSTGEYVMSVTMPLYSTGRIVGVIRNIGSLQQVDNNLFRIAALFFVIGGLITGIAMFMGTLMVERMIAPILGLTDSAREMADGNYNVRSRVFFDDEVGELSQTFNYMVSEIKKKNDLKNEFISSISHELRTPLTAIKGWAYTLKDPSTDEELLHSGLEIIEKESDRLKGMVDELLDFSKFSGGKIELKFGVVDPLELKDFIEILFKKRAEKERKNFEVVIPDNISKFRGDENRIKQVLINLLDNAIKFTDPGDTIKVSMTQNKEFTIMEVYDTGIGIEAGDLDKVTEKFYKGKHGKASNGIGLSIANEIVHLHRGTLNIESKVNEFTRMTVSLPRGANHEKIS